jgi:MOSC domain-containing protein YiiM
VTGRIVQVSVSAGGVPKTAIESAKVTSHGLEGDRHRDHEHHGGPERAVCIFSVEAIEALKAEGHPVVPGGLGENLTIAGLDWSAVVPEAILKIGNDLVVQITRYTSPCVNITRSFLHGDYSRVSQKRHPGSSRVYARVLVPGSVKTGDTVRVVADTEARAIVGSLRL